MNSTFGALKYVNSSTMNKFGLKNQKLNPKINFNTYTRGIYFTFFAADVILVKKAYKHGKERAAEGEGEKEGIGKERRGEEIRETERRERNKRR